MIINNLRKPLFLVIGLSIFTVAKAEVSTSEYTYDEVGRLKTVDQVWNSQTAYQYDKSDNRTKKTVQQRISGYAVNISDYNVTNKMPSGTSNYMLKSDGTIQITHSVPQLYNGQTYHIQKTSIIGRWLAQGLVATDFLIKGTLANGSGSWRNCSNGSFYSLHGGHSPNWTMTTTPQEGTKKCRVFIEIRGVANQSILLKSAFITLSAGPAG